MSSILVDTPSQQGEAAPKLPTREAQLVSWVMSRVNRWREYRDNAFKQRWGEYYRLWRGRWSAEDRTRNSERSRLIAPALSQAIEMTVAEMEEATFGRTQWFDVRDDINAPAQEMQAMIQARDNLLEDANELGVPDAISSAYLNGALYGNGIAKLVVDTKVIREPGPVVDGKRKINERKKVVVRLDALPADEVVPDPSGTNVDEMLGIAHELVKPKAWVDRLRARGVFSKEVLAGDGQESQLKDVRADLEGHLNRENTVFITEYHGLVPARLLPKKGEDTELDLLLAQEEIKSGDETLVEAIVTIANKGEFLRATKNPFWMQDRSIVSYQHEKVPGRFWGRGVAEKGFNPQKALDAELRSRMDALALISNPMMAADITRLPRGFDRKVRPGKLWMVNGDPNKALVPVVFPGLDATTFNQSGEMERMVQMGTGAMDSATPTQINSRNDTATGTSLQQAGFVKRSKRAMSNVSRNFLKPIIQKMMWRYMQFDSTRYPVDVDFRVMGTLGIVARELEQNQLTQLVGLVPEGSAPQMVLIKAIFDNSSSPYKGEVNAAIDSMLNPSPEQVAEQNMQKQLQMAAAQAELQKINLENAKLQSEVVLNIAKAQAQEVKSQIEGANLELEVQRLVKELGELQELGRQNDVALINAQANLMKAQNSNNGGNNGNNQQ